MVERLLDLDPTLSDAEGSDIYSKVINPLFSRLGTDPKTVDIETFITDRMSSEFPDLDISSPGSVLRDLLISPLVLLLEPIRREINAIRLQLSLADSETLTSDELDALLSNVFAIRRIGDFSRGSVRVFFSSPQATPVDQSIVFSTADGTTFVPTQVRTFLASEMVRSGNLYYIDIPVRSVLPDAQANVAKNTIRFVNGLDGVVRVTNRASLSGGVSEETSEEFLVRAERSLSERSLNTKRGIETTILNSFDDIVSLEVVGFGEPLMQRDILKGTSNADVDEILGPLVYAASDYRAEPVLRLTHSSNEEYLIPFTNTIRLRNVPAANLSKVKASKYLRIIGGGEDFDSTLISRVRGISEIYEDGSDVIVVVNDFTVYPRPTTATVPKKSEGADIFTHHNEFGFNKYATQGSDYSLIRTADLAGDGTEVDVIVGAPLPFTDYVEADALSDTPESVALGSDFLVVTQAYDPGASYDGARNNINNNYKVPAKIRLFPITSVLPDHKIRVGRTDAFVTSRDRINYQGESSFDFTPSSSISGFAEGVRVLDFGGPALTNETEASRFDGTTLESWSKSAGVSLELRDPGYQADLWDISQTLDVTNLGAEIKECDVVLNSNTTSWSTRGIKVGHFISLAVFDYAGTALFKGAVSDVNNEILWTAWGVVKKIDPNDVGDFHRIRVSGLDWVGAFENQLASLNTGSLVGVSGSQVSTAGVIENQPVTSIKFEELQGGLRRYFIETPEGLELIDPGGQPGYKILALSDETTGYLFMAVAQSGQLIQLTYNNGNTSNLVNNVGFVNPYTGVAKIEPTVSITDSYTWSIQKIRVIDDKYRLFWTAFEGSREMVAPDGKPAVSYDELVFPPAFKVTANDIIKDQGEVAALSNVDYFGDETTTVATAEGKPHALGDTGHNRPYGSQDSIQSTHAWWIRLGKSFSSQHNSLGATPAEKCVSAELVRIHSAVTNSANESIINDAPSDLTFDHSITQLFYPRERFTKSAPITTLGDSTTLNTVKTVLSSPYIPGSQALSNETSSNTSLTVYKSASNQKAHSGFLIPYPLGPSTSQDTSGPYDDTIFGTTAPMVCLHESLDTSTLSVSGITVSDIPGSVPFPGFFAGGLQVEPDEIHIGGLTDVYLKPTTSTANTTGRITLTPGSLLNTDEVFMAGGDGKVNTGTTETSTHFISQDLSTYIATNFAANTHLDNLVIQLLDPPPELSPTSFRILNTVSGGVRIDGSFSGVQTLSSIRFRLLKTCTTSLNKPLFLLQQGSDLKALANGLDVDFGDGVNFSNNVEDYTVYVHIDEGDNYGEYRVTSKSATSLGIQTPTPFSGSGLSYRIYTKQSSAVSLPLVRVNDLSLSGDSQGIQIPYKDPIAIRSSSFSGLNDDPVTDVATGQVGQLAGDQALGRFFVPSVNFVNLGITKYDVLRIDNTDDPLKYFYVTGFETSSGGTANDTLILDRAVSLSAPLTSLKYTLGKPSVGTADLIFKDKTFIGVGPDTTLSFTSESGVIYKFRPSPAETAELYKSAVDSTSITTATTTVTGDTLVLTGDNWFKYGIKAGDKVKVTSRTLSSGQFTQAQSEALQISGSTLALKVGSEITNVVFTGTNPLTLADVSININRQMSGKLSTSVVGVGNNFVLKFSCSDELQILDTGSIGILSTLKLTDTDTSEPASLIGTFTVASLSYDTTTSSSKLTLTTGTNNQIGYEVFVEVTRDAHQNIYPGNLETLSTGLFSGQIKLTSLDPLTTETVTAGQDLDISGHTSLGYEFLVENNSYSYSMGENVSVKTTSVILPDYATSHEEVYTLPGAGMTVSYDTAPEVDSIQSFMLQPDVRVVCNNPLVKHYYPAYPIFSLDYTGSSPVAEVKAAITDFFATLYPNRPLEIFDLTTLLSRNRITFVTYPLEVSFVTHDKDRKIKLVTANNVLALDNSFHIMEDMSGVTITRVG